MANPVQSLNNPKAQHGPATPPEPYVCNTSNRAAEGRARGAIQPPRQAPPPSIPSVAGCRYVPSPPRRRASWAFRTAPWRAASPTSDDPLVEILSRLPAESICRFKCVSKPWRDLIADLIHRKKLPFDGDEKTSRIIRWIEKHGFLDFLGQSHGNLYCISGDIDDSYMITEMSIWVLEDYHTEEWVLRYSVSIFQLFGKMRSQFGSYEVVTIHPDCNLVFFVEYDDLKLISYNMDSKEVCDVCTLGRSYGRITPYDPYFSDLSVLGNKH
ncbi:hypothetical protein HU200_039504 [Digitaria exilis]|uniref:F-box domain-containing protein n=1 Tax=Digitaria exilis TaxID=1010633 RepID=A0A835BMB7_9POAL|nr:hypothetical protein HU200_039504 [Digitaria exilis]